MLSKPLKGTPNRLYFSVTDQVISSVLVQDEGRGQRLVYFVSKVLQGVELRYQNIEKATFIVNFIAQRLRYFFQSFTIIIMIDLPIKQVLRKPDVTGQMIRWAIYLSEFDVSYEPLMTFYDKCTALLEVIMCP